ncbi:MAG: ASKHA domain-containing protein, partial [Actinomycetota bacterium]|nr:ASKHA domain-containing protein [Actinomycetota bacterium]
GGRRVETGSTANLTEEELAKGYVLACKTPVFRDLKIEIPVESELVAKGRSKIKTLTSSIDSWNEQLAALEFDPPVVKKYFELAKPSLSDSVSDMTRISRLLRRELDVDEVKIDLDTVKRVPDIVRRSHWRITVTALREADHCRVIAIEPGDTTKKYYALAVDIGTTTCAAQIIDLNARQILAEASEYNRQVGFGDDVISRMVYAKKARGREVLQAKAAQTIDRLVATTTKEAGIEPGDITVAVMAGNTIMTHLLLGVGTDEIREAPYVPVFRFAPTVDTDELGLKTLSGVPVIFYPCVAGYLGGDITSGVVAADMVGHEDLTLYIDIGTNGEIVLGNKEWLLGCSCSAGPAFEGAGVKDGVRSIDGAIERVIIEPGTLEIVFTTIGGHLPIGICGSGLIDLLAELFKAGAVDKRGKFHQDLESDRVRQGEYGWEFVVAWAKMTAVGRDIVLTEVDIDNLMRAKAAVYAGITTLAASVGIDLADLREIMIAGSFGNYIKVEEAVTIGLLPDLPVDRFTFVGNGSLLGSAKGAVSRRVLAKAMEITRSMSYMELSADNTFMDKYVSALFLPHTNEKLFPSVHIGKALKKVV